jgi:hypothetical protein
MGRKAVPAFDEDYVSDPNLRRAFKRAGLFNFTCKLYRGSSTNPLLVMNDWADIFPPRPSPNVPLVQKDFIIKRAHECAVERGKIPNLIMTDYYNRGDVVGAVSELNGVAAVKPASINEVEFG